MNEFIEFLSYPNDANYKDDIYKLIDFTENKFNSLDFKTTRLITETLPLLLAEKEIDRDLNTVLIYLHLDGQPIDISRWNQEDPFSPVFKKRVNDNFEILNWNDIQDYSYEELDNNDVRIFARSSSAVSYTHLTLPTILHV